jgi:hypothetical protein
LATKKKTSLQIDGECPLFFHFFFISPFLYSTSFGFILFKKYLLISMSDEHPTSSSSQTNPSTTSASSDTPSTTTNNSTTTVTTVTNDNNTSSSVLIGLQIKSLEQRTHSVTLPRNSSVLQLKNEIQSTLDVDSGRQRLIFQGKVLKDDKNLMDYGKKKKRRRISIRLEVVYKLNLLFFIFILANLDDGKVIHLVIRPLDAPQNPLNGKKTKVLEGEGRHSKHQHTFFLFVDEPRPAGRRVFGNRGRSFPSIASRLPMMEGYTFITLDAHIGDNGDSNSVRCPRKGKRMGLPLVYSYDVFFFLVFSCMSIVFLFYHEWIDWCESFQWNILNSKWKIYSNIHKSINGKNQQS